MSPFVEEGCQVLFLSGTIRLHMDWKLIPEPEVEPTLLAAIQRMLVASFPEYQDFFSAHSYWGSTPEFRLIATDEYGHPIAHLEFGFRTITVGETSFEIAGIGAVAVHPDFQGRQLGKVMFSYLRQWLLKNSSADFGFLGCRKEVVPFYTSAGFIRVDQDIFNLDPDSRAWTIYNGPTMLLPVHAPIERWRLNELVHLHGLPW